MARSALDALLGRLFDDGEELELAGGLNFIGFTITFDAANNRYDIDSAGAFVPTSRTITAGTNLTGGGDLSADRTLALSATPTGLTSLNGATLGAPVQGTAITTTSTVSLANGSKYDVTAASAYTITLGTGGSPADGDTVTFRCTNALANAITVTNGGTGGGNIGISGGMPAGVKAEYTFYYDGTATAWKYGGRVRIA